MGLFSHSDRRKFNGKRQKHLIADESTDCMRIMERHPSVCSDEQKVYPVIQDTRPHRPFSAVDEEAAERVVLVSGVVGQSNPGKPFFKRCSAQRVRAEVCSL